MRALIVFTILAVFCAGQAQADSQRPNLKNLDKPIELNAGKSPRMYVIFNHSTHKTVKCRTCHHDGLPGNRYAACTSPDCHSIQGAKSRDPMSVYMAYHAPDTDRSCLGCHKALAAKNPEQYPAFKGCRPCHVSPISRKIEQETAKQ